MSNTPPRPNLTSVFASLMLPAALGSMVVVLLFSNGAKVDALHEAPFHGTPKQVNGTTYFVAPDGDRVAVGTPKDGFIIMATPQIAHCRIEQKPDPSAFADSVFGQYHIDCKPLTKVDPQSPAEQRVLGAFCARAAVVLKDPRPCDAVQNDIRILRDIYTDNKF